MLRFKDRKVYIPKLIATKVHYSYMPEDKFTLYAKSFICVGRDAEVKSIIANYVSLYSSHHLEIFDENETTSYVLDDTGDSRLKVFRQRSGDMMVALLKYDTVNIITNARSLFLYLQNQVNTPIANEWADAIWNYFLENEILTELFTAGVDSTYYEVDQYKGNMDVILQDFIKDNLPRLRSLLKYSA